MSFWLTVKLPKIADQRFSCVQSLEMANFCAAVVRNDKRPIAQQQVAVSIEIGLWLTLVLFLGQYEPD